MERYRVIDIGWLIDEAAKNPLSERGVAFADVIANSKSIKEIVIQETENRKGMIEYHSAAIKGLHTTDAIEYLNRNQLTARIVSLDGVTMPGTDDIVPFRVNMIVEDDIVKSTYVG